VNLNFRGLHFESTRQTYTFTRGIFILVRRTSVSIIFNRFIIIAKGSACLYLLFTYGYGNVRIP
jgi:hypothetical protein